MSAEQAKETPKITAKNDEEQSAGEPTKEIAKIEEDEEGISVPNWLIETLEWIKRMEMVESKMSTSCLAFKQLCWPKLHGKVQPHFVKSLHLDKKRDQSGNFQGIVRNRYDSPMLPIPQVPPPEYILGFQRLTIRFLDERLVEFIKLIAPKFNDIYFQVCTDITKDGRPEAIGRLLDIFGNKITKLRFNYDIQHFHRLFPGFIDSNQIKQIGLNNKFTRERIDILFDWLMNGRQNDGQKILDVDRAEWGPEHIGFVERIKKVFLTDTVRRNFLVYFQLDDPVDEFIEENEKTGEILQFYWDQENECQGLMRCPKEEEDRWKKEGEKKLEGNDEDGTTTRVYLSISEIEDPDDEMFYALIDN